MRQMMIVLFLAALLWFAVSSPNADRVVSAHSAGSAPVQATTPQPVVIVKPAAQTSPIVGILILLAPAAFVIWRKSRPNAHKQVEAACCAPIVDKD